MSFRTLSATALTPAMKRWWWTSAPYVLSFSLIVIIAKPAPGILAHIIFPLLLLFWLTLYSSIAWTFVAGVRVALSRRLGSTNAAMLGAAVVAAAVGVYGEFFWAGNVG